MDSRIHFLCVGAQKSGTTTLRAYLREHPQLDVPAKELHFFDNESHEWKRRNKFHGYHQNFKSLTLSTRMKGGKTLQHSRRVYAGEATPIYMYWLPSLQRIYRYNPNIKLIFVLRNPMARAYSHWSMEYSRGSESLPFADAIRIEKTRYREAGSLQHRVYSYIGRGYYFMQISRFLEFFPFQNIRILSAEQLYCSPGAVLKEISQFLEVDDFFVNVKYHHRKGAYRGALGLDDWRYMYDLLADDISNLSRLVDWDTSSWTVPWDGLE